MEQSVEFLGVFFRVIAVRAFALSPGTLVWLSVIALVMLARQISYRLTG